MSFLNLAKKRYSVRAYKSTPIEDEKLQQVLEAARLAPTAANFQPFKLVVIQTKGRGEELRRIYNADWFVQAPIVICACGMRNQSWIRKLDNRNYCDVDIAIAMDHLILAATDLGLGTCWVGFFDPEIVREVLELSDDLEPVVFTPLGYPDDTSKPKKRKPIDELVQYQ